MSDKTLKQKQQRQDKEKQAYAFYVAQGWTPEQAIGIVGNLIRESNLNTTVVGTADDKKSQGVAQWHSGRLKTLKDRYGDKWTDFRNQLEFVDWELKNTEKSAGDKLKASKGIWEAGKIVSDSYERPKVKFSGDETRQRHVSDLAMKFKGVKLTPEDMPYFDASYANSVAPYMNQPQETITPTLNYFGIPKETPTFVSVPDSAEEKKKETVEDGVTSKDVAEVEQKTKEYNFLEELQKEDYSHLQPEQVAQQQIVPQVDFNQQYEQVSQFIDEPLVAQQGLTWQEKLANRPRKPTVAEIIAEGDARKVQQRTQVDNTKVSNYNNARVFNPNVRNKTDKEIAQEREAKIQASVEAQKTPYTRENWRQQLASETAATGDKLRVSNEPNFFDDYINPAAMIGSMASNLGQAPLQAQQSDSVMPYVTAIGTPLVTGALAGIGAKTTGQFANNIVNPLAGTRDLVNNLGNKYLPNAYKYNPLAFKPKSDAYYRQVFSKNEIENPLITRSMQKNNDPKGITAYINSSEEKFLDGGSDTPFELLKLPTTESLPYFNKGKPYYTENYTKFKNKELLLESNKKFKDYEDFNPAATNYMSDKPEQIEQALQMSGDIRVLNPFSKEGFDLSSYNKYKKDWLQGYKQVEIPKKPQNFNSEINWGNWNKEIPENTQLMKEYNTIEQTSKANDTWMKNPDGSKFTGTPEQFIQQNSENFKRVFGSSIIKDEKGNPLEMYHGSRQTNIMEFLPPKENSNWSQRTMTNKNNNYNYFTRDKDLANSYRYKVNDGTSDELGDLHSVYIDSKHPLFTEDYSFLADPEDMGKDLTKYDTITNSEEMFHTKPVFTEVAVPHGNNVKSSIGNNGMFDMNNPNIYKSVVPIAGASYLATQGQEESKKFQSGGSVKEDKEWLQNWYQNRVIPDEVIQNEYFLPQQKDYINRAKNLKDPKVVDQVTSPDGMPVEGVTRANGDMELSKNAAPHVQLHEMTHSINKYPFLMQDIHESVVKQNIAPIEGIENEDVKKYYDYFSNPEEVHARIQVLRKEAKIKPDQKVTSEFLQNYLKTYKGENSNINDLLNVADEPHLLEMLNYMAETPKNKEKQYIAQQGGEFSENELAFLSEIAIKDNNGYWNKNNQGKVVEIQGGEITMNGVDQDLIGIGIDKKGKKTERKLMKTGKNYSFDKAIKVIEIPLFKK